MSSGVRWLGTSEACERLGVNLRTLYRFIDEGQLLAYRFGRVIRIKEEDLADFVERCRIVPGELEHLYDAEARSVSSASADNGT
jgi:excisionase family DNA binding protein